MQSSHTQCFILWMGHRNYSHHTIRAYKKEISRRDARMFLRAGELSSLSALQINTYLCDISGEVSLQVADLAANAIRCFLKYCRYHDIPAVDPKAVIYFKTPKKKSPFVKK